MNWYVLRVQPKGPILYLTDHGVFKTTKADWWTAEAEKAGTMLTRKAAENAVERLAFHDGLLISRRQAIREPMQIVSEEELIGVVLKNP